MRRPAGTLVHDRRVLLRSHLPDLTPLRENAAYRRLYAGFTLSNIGSQIAVVAIGLQVYEITGSTASVGLVGLFALVPLVAFGTEAGLFKRAGIPTVVCGPGSIVQAHQPDEYVSLEQLARCEDFMRGLATAREIG